MTNQPTLLTVSVGGMNYSSFTRASVTYAANQAARAFAFTVTDAINSWGDQWNFMPGTEITVLANGQLIVTGYIDKMSPSFDSKNHTVEVSGRSKGADAIHSSVENEKGEFRNQTVLQIAQALDKQGIGFSSDTQQQQVEYHRLNPGESVFDSIERLCRRFPQLMQGMPDGSIKLTKGGTGGSNSPLIEGINILGGSATFDQTDGHSEYKVKGQRVYGTTKNTLQITATANDSTMKRHRPKHIHQEGDIDQNGAQSRANAHKNRQQGESVSASIKAQSWFDDSGQLWIANGLVYVMSPTLKLQQQMLIKSVSLSQDATAGSTAQLSLVLPQAFDGEGTGMGGSGNTGSAGASQWSSG